MVGVVFYETQWFTGMSLGVSMLSNNDEWAVVQIRPVRDKSIKG